MKYLELILERRLDEIGVDYPEYYAERHKIIASLVEIVRERGEALEKIYCPDDIRPPVFLGVKHSDFCFKCAALEKTERKLREMIS